MLPSNASEFDQISPVSKRGGPPAGLIITVVLVLALAAVIGVAVSRLAGTSVARPTPVAAPTSAAAASSAQNPAASGQAAAGAGAPADSATQQAIQQVIQQVDDAQVQAIKTNDPNVMAATATPQFYQEQVVNNQQLLDGGVTDIKLIQLEWGQINVNGNTATATVWETWSTTFDDGTTEQARDRNVYTLVQDNGTWKVQADDHPDQASSATPPPAPGP
jgi:ketosteroid isomerase-like protein